jgi:arginine/ornithine N-succinyltransferase beta subunit
LKDAAKQEAWRLTMGEGSEKQVYVRVKDGAGNQFLCPIDALKDIKKATEQELENCVDNAVAERYAGEIKVLEK